MKESRIFCKSGIAGLFLAALAFVSGAAAEDATVYVDRYGNVVKQVLRYRRLLMQGRENNSRGTGRNAGNRNSRFAGGSRRD